MWNSVTAFTWIFENIFVYNMAIKHSYDRNGSTLVTGKYMCVHDIIAILWQGQPIVIYTNA